jgi:polyferredoxin
MNPGWMEIAGRLERWAEAASSNIKMVDTALSGMDGSYVELLTILALGMLAIVPVLVPERRRQRYRHMIQLFGIFIFIFVVFTCLGVFGMIRNFHRGLMEIGRENIIALYFCSVPVTIMATSMIFGPFFCGWICPTGALQEFAGMLTRRMQREHKRTGYRFSPRILASTAGVAIVFLVWMAYLSVTRIFFIEDATIYWSEALILILGLLTWRMQHWDARLRRLRYLSFAIIAGGAVAGWRVTSPVHFSFAKIYDPASLLSTVIVILGAMVIPHVWCRYLCPWREAIAWAGRHSARKLVTTRSRCTSCGKCDEVCGVDAVSKGTVTPHECHMCLKCVDTCPTHAIEMQDDWSPRP